MKSCRFWRVASPPFGRGVAQPKSGHSSSLGRRDEGFTLVELLIVVTIVPIIIGALATGLLAMFTLQSSVSSRLSNTGEAQVVAANFRIDVQSAAYVTTDPGSTPQCGTGNQLLGLEWNPAPGGGFQTIVSYVSVPVVSGGTTTYSLVRMYCTGGSLTPVSSTTISSNLVSSQPPPTVTCSASAASCNSAGAWITTQSVTGVSFQVQQPETGPNGGTGTGVCSSGLYCYTLAAVPAMSATAGSSGGPINVNTTAGCGFASPGTGTFASSLCLVDFSGLTGNNMIAARQGCLQFAVPLPGNSTLYFCIGITGGTVAPYALPTWTQSFLGNTLNGVPFYTGIPGQAALYQNGAGNNGGTTVITLSNITVVGPTGTPATGWQIVGVDAESSDNGESITFTSDKPLYLIPNTPTSPVGNAYNSGANIVPQSVLTPGNGATTIVFNGQSTSGQKTGTGMVEATTPTTFKATMVGAGLEGMSFGLMF